jgi:type IV pilus assembly protein PilV
MLMNTLHPNARVRGFSLVEVMVALVVISVGLLGIAKMQALALANTTISRQRSIAAIEAASLAAAMRANRLYWGSTPPGFLVTWAAKNAPAFVSTPPTGDAVLAAAANAGNGHACDGAAGVAPACAYTANNQALAAADLAGWATAVSAVLPNPSATINCGVPLGTTLPAACTIQIVWSESSVAMTTQEAAQEAAAQAGNTQGQFEKPSYQLYVEP